MENPSHIVPLLIGDPLLCKRITDALLDRFGIYVQPINYPTVLRGTERLRLTPTPHHSDADMDRLLAALRTLWAEMGIPFERQAEAAAVTSASCVTGHGLTLKTSRQIRLPCEGSHPAATG
jgi:hypothetical protein